MSKNEKRRLIDRNGLRDVGVCFSNKHLLSLERRGLFPKRVRLAPQTVCWLEHEISEWLEARIAERD
ncbi:MAG: AlpA family phage regulatory protein [Alphaproteobacteria bacterium]